MQVLIRKTATGSRPLSAAVVLVSALLLGAHTPAAPPPVGTPGEDPFIPVRPAPPTGEKATAGSAPGAMFDEPTGATVYVNEDEPFGVSPPGASDPRFLGEQISLLPNSSAPLEIREVEFGMLVQATTGLVVTVRIWDNYDPLATPVYSGLLRSETVDLGTWQQSPPSTFYPSVKVLFMPPLPLADPNVFITFEFRSSFGGPYAPIQPIFALNPGGPEAGTSTNDFFRDLAPGDGLLMPSERRAFGSSSCTPDPPGCQSNLYLHVRGAPNPNVIDPGMDLWRTLPNGSTKQVFPPEEPLPLGFFGPCAQPGQNSDPFTGTIVLGGEPLVTNPPGALDLTDTVIVRDGMGDLPTPGASVVIPIEIVALSLQSVAPITVTYDGGTLPELWNVHVVLSDLPQQEGTLTATRGACDGAGGTFSASLPVRTKLIFTRSSDSCRVVLDTGVIGQPPTLLSLVNGHWIPYAPPHLGLKEYPFPGVGIDANADGTFELHLPTTSNFHPGARVPRCGCCQAQPTSCASPVLPAQCAASGGTYFEGSACNGSGICEAACGPAGPEQMRLTHASAPLASHSLIPSTFLTQDNDSDLVIDIADNCIPGAPGTYNPLQEDVDDDGVGDICDNCPTGCNPGQEDSDSDGVAGPCDCSPLDPTLKTIPPRVGELSISRTSVAGDLLLSWTSLDPVAGTATAYDAARGSLSSLHAGGYPGGASCAADALGDTPHAEGAAACASSAGEGCWYLVRAENACGFGSFADPTQALPHPLDPPSSPCP